MYNVGKYIYMHACVCVYVRAAEATEVNVFLPVTYILSLCNPIFLFTLHELEH